MTSSIILKNQTSKNEPLEAVFLPEKGMNLLSYKKGHQEVIDQATKETFEASFNGLGSLIGPHFFERKPALIAQLKPDSIFTHIASLNKQGYSDPFTRGIGRYAPWKVLDHSSTQVKASLSGKDTWQGEPLSTLEGQPFTLELSAELKPDGLSLQLSVVSESDSLIGIHYCYALPNGKGKVISDVKPQFFDQGSLKAIPESWQRNFQGILTFDLEQSADYAFLPFQNPLNGKITLETPLYTLQTSYSCLCQENAWHLYHPSGASFVCIAPISAQNPWKPNLTASSIHIHLEILS